MTAVLPDRVAWTAEDPANTTPAPCVRLRPIVHASPVAAGVHLRGWSSSFTLGGGAGVWTIWQRLSPVLAEGRPVDRLLPESAPAAVRQVVDRLVAELWRHDMLVVVPADWHAATGDDGPPDDVRTWLEAVADRPDHAWRRLTGSRFAVSGDGPVAWSAIRALTRTGLAVDHTAAVGAPDHVTLAAGGWQVRAVADDVVGCVLPPGWVDSGDAIEVSDALAVAGRVGSTGRHDGATPLHSLVGGAAAHRLVCAVGGLPDPGHERGARGPAHAADPVPAGWRAATVFVARMDPLRADHHPWLGVDPVGAAVAPAGLEDALARLDALCDPELGPVEENGRAELPQVPAGLGSHRVGPLAVAGVGATADVARIVSGTAAVAELAGRRLGRRVVAGATPAEAVGRALREVWAARPEPGEVRPAAAWEGHPAARRWWKALTLHGGVDASMVVEQLAPVVHRATVRDAAGVVLGVAVERDPGDAAAFAALAAAGRRQWHEHVGGVPGPVASACGATPSAPRDLAAAPAWVDDAWVWPAGVARHEAQFVRRLAAGPAGSPLEIRVVADHRVADLARTHTLVEVPR